MRAPPTFLALSALGLLAGRAAADPPAATATPVARVVPTLSLSGSTTGRGKISAGLDIRTSSHGGRWEPHLAPSFTLAGADGVAPLLSLSGDGSLARSPEWALGLTLSMVDTHPEDWLPSQEDFLRAYARCQALGAPPAGAAGGVTEKQLCAEGRAMLQVGDARRAERGRYPRTILALGATYGTTQLRTLMGPTTALSPSSEPRSNVLVGGLFTYVAPSEGAHLTLEVPLLFKSSYRAPGATARWCVPVGTVIGKTGTSAAQACEELPLGAPMHQGQAWAAVLLGAATEKGSVRFAAGPTFSWDVASPSTAPYQIGIKVPFYLRVLKGLGGYSGDFDGFVRVVPSFALSHTDKGLAPVGMITVELIGKRGMFGSSLYWP